VGRAAAPARPAGLELPALKLFDPAFQAFVRAHEGEDPAGLVLRSTPPGIDARAAAEQIESRRKARGKLPRWLARDGVVMPPPLAVEQASSEATAAYKAELVSGETLVDLSGGMGVDTLALAPRFRHTCYVEADAHLCRVFAHNAALLSECPPEVVNTSAEAFATGFDGRASFYVDPARRAGGRRVFRFADSSPDVTALLPLLRSRAEQVLIKASPMIDLQEGLRCLAEVQAVHVVSVDDACREVLFLVVPGWTGEPAIHCAALSRRGAAAASPANADPDKAGPSAPAGTATVFSFDFAAEQAAVCTFAEPDRYLYDPNPAIRKAGAFKSVADRFGLAKLAPSTHLYTAQELLPEFPGRIFEVAGPGGKRPGKLLPDGRANVMSRNHPLKADALRERYRLKDGGEHWLIGFRDQRGKARTLIARRVDGPAATR